MNLPSIGESDPSLLKLKLPRKPGGENCGGLSGGRAPGNWRPSSRARISGSWGSEASIAAAPGGTEPAPSEVGGLRKGGSCRAPAEAAGKGKGGRWEAADWLSLASSAALAARLSGSGRGRGSRPSILCSIMSPAHCNNNTITPCTTATTCYTSIHVISLHFYISYLSSWPAEVWRGRGRGWVGGAAPGGGPGGEWWAWPWWGQLRPTWAAHCVSVWGQLVSGRPCKFLRVANISVNFQFPSQPSLLRVFWLTVRSVNTGAASRQPPAPHFARLPLAARRWFLAADWWRRAPGCDVCRRGRSVAAPRPKWTRINPLPIKRGGRRW